MRASVGFALVVDRLMTALSRQKIEIPVTDVRFMLLYPGNLLKWAIDLAKEYRKQGILVAMIRKNESLSLVHYKDYAKSHQIQRIVCLNWTQKLGKLRWSYEIFDICAGKRTAGQQNTGTFEQMGITMEEMKDKKYTKTHLHQ